MTVKTNQDIKKMSFEDALKELETIVSGLESGEVQLENAIESYARGAALKDHCQSKLNEAKLKIEKINAQGEELKAEAFKPA